MNWVFFVLIGTAYLATVLNQWQWSHAAENTASPMQALTEQLFQTANEAVTLSIGLIGVLSLFLGLLQIAEKGGLLNTLAKLIYPLLKWLFPEIPPNHPALGAMMMNISANLLGAGNAATPFGLKAMQELEKINPNPGVASNAMILFLAINTSSVTLLPIKILALRVSAGSLNASSIIPTTLIATVASTFIAIVTAKLFQKMLPSPAPINKIAFNTENTVFEHFPAWVSLMVFLVFLSFIPITILWGNIISAWIIPTFIVAILGYGIYKKIDIYTTFTEGAKEGFETALKIIPFLVAILVAIGMFRTSGAMGAICKILSPITEPLGLPAQALPMVFMRPLSGSGSLGVLTDIFNNPALGPDSYVGNLVSTMMGSTETTFYILAVYFGAVQIRRIRHALAVGLIADLAGMVASVIAVKLILF